MLERNFQSDLVRQLTKVGALILNVHGHAMQKSGWPDLFVAHVLWYGWIELKRETEVMTQLQKFRIKDLRDRGVDALCVRFQVQDEVVWIYAEDDKGTDLREPIVWSAKMDGLEIMRWLAQGC